MKSYMHLAVLVSVMGTICGGGKPANFHAKLHSPELEALDGVPGLIDGNAIKDIMHIRKGVTEIAFGVATDKRGLERTGKYTFNGKKYGIHELAEIEKTKKKQLAAAEALARRKYRGSDLTSNLNKLRSEYEHDMAKLNECLNKGKEDFRNLAFHFLRSIQAAKHMIVKLMKESCAQRGIKQSIMLRWGDANDNNAAAEFDAAVKNNADFAEFLEHLRNFLGDLIDNCQRGYKQFRDWFIQA